MYYFKKIIATQLLVFCMFIGQRDAMGDLRAGVSTGISIPGFRRIDQGPTNGKSSGTKSESPSKLSWKFNFDKDLPVEFDEKSKKAKISFGDDPNCNVEVDLSRLKDSEKNGKYFGKEVEVDLNNCRFKIKIYGWTDKLESCSISFEDIDTYKDSFELDEASADKFYPHVAEALKNQKQLAQIAKEEKPKIEERIKNISSKKENSDFKVELSYYRPDNESFAIKLNGQVVWINKKDFIEGKEIKVEYNDYTVKYKHGAGMKKSLQIKADNSIDLKELGLTW